MNWLAHLVLSPRDPRVRLGNWLADLLPAAELEAWADPAIQAGVALHRVIDRFTDTHPRVLASQRRLPPGVRRYGGIVIDIAYDHFLSRQFAALTGGDLDPFLQEVYRDFTAQRDRLGEAVQSALDRMIAENWLGCYRRLEDVELTFTRLARRMSPRARAGFSPAAARAGLEAAYAELAVDFRDFWPELVAAVERAGNPAPAAPLPFPRPERPAHSGPT